MEPARWKKREKNIGAKWDVLACRTGQRKGQRRQESNTLRKKKKVIRRMQLKDLSQGGNNKKENGLED